MHFYSLMGKGYSTDSSLAWCWWPIFNWNQIKLPGKNAKHNSMSWIWNRLGQLSLALKEAYQHQSKQRFWAVELLENNTLTLDGNWAIGSSFPNQNMIATKFGFAMRFGLNTWITGRRELGRRTDPRRKHLNGRLEDNDQRRQHDAWSLRWMTVWLVHTTGN